MTLRNVGRWLGRGGWVLSAGVLAWLVAFSGTDPASTILFALAILAVAAALSYIGCAMDARGVRRKLVWIGRALAFLGAAFAVSFPGQLYQEILMLLSRGQTPAEWYPRAIWYSAATMPLVVVPALVALRRPRLAGVLFALDGIFNVAEYVYRPFGVIFPEATTDPLSLMVFAFLPAFVTAAVLLVGSTGAAGDGLLHQAMTERVVDELRATVDVELRHDP